MVARLLILVALFTAWSAMAERSRWDDLSPADASHQALRVTRYLKAAGDDQTKPLVILSGGRAAGVIVGTNLRVYRQGHSIREQAGRGRSQARGEPLWVEMGQLQVVEVQDNVAVARVENEGGAMAQAFFPRFPGIMAGDLAVERRLTIARNQVAAPTVSVTYQEIFADPKRLPSSFELSAEGYEKLRELATRFAQMRLSMLMIEGYTDYVGSTEQNQVESYQRAMTIRQFLVDELGFDEKRVVAIGFGEGEPADPSMVSGHIEANRRIVLKAITMPTR